MKNKKYPDEGFLKLHSEGKTCKEISNILNCSYPVVTTRLRQLNLKPNFDKNGNVPLNIIDKLNAKCSKCHEIKLITEFHLQRGHRITYCNSCRRKQFVDNLNSNIDTFLKSKYGKLKVRAKSENVKFSLTLKDYIDLYYSQNGKCFYLGVDLDCVAGKGLSLNNISADKIIPENGYVPGNVVLCTWKANTMKGNLTLNELKEWIPKFYKKIKEYLK